MIQQIVIGLIFLFSVGYVVRILVRSFQAKHACASGCGKCAVADIDMLQKTGQQVD